ncbi:hypothetical protein VPHD479_0107 [Vibrio phage D479]
MGSVGRERSLRKKENIMALPRLYVNKNLKSDDGKIYNACIGDFDKIILFPVKQCGSGRVTYYWQRTCGGRQSEVFDSAKLALANAVEILG